jgi:hypothetical protein
MTEVAFNVRVMQWLQRCKRGGWIQIVQRAGDQREVNIAVSE